MMEAALILHFETTGVNIDLNYNWTTACDYGGEGPNRDEDAHRTHYVYLTLKPVNMTAAEWTAASAHLPAENPIGDIYGIDRPEEPSGDIVDDADPFEPWDNDLETIMLRR